MTIWPYDVVQLYKKQSGFIYTGHDGAYIYRNHLPAVRPLLCGLEVASQGME